MGVEGKRLLILGGSRITCEIIKHAKRMGVVTAVTDWYPLEKSPAKQIADEAYYESTSDINAMSKLVQEKKFDGVLTGFTDSVLPYYAKMCEENNLPSYGTEKQFDIFIDKDKYKKLMRKYGVPTVPEYSIDIENVEESAKDIKYPLLVKPSDSSGARGITICHDIEELKKAVSIANEASKTKKIIVEQYLDGPECTIFWLFKNGKYYMMLMGNRHVKYNQEGVIPLPVGYTYPASIQPKFLKETAPKMEEMFRSVGIKNGMMFMQCKIVDDECVVYDIGYRLTGSLEYINIKEMCGFDPLDMLINFALTGDMGEPDLDVKADPNLGGKYSFNVSILSKPGKIKRIEGLETVRSMPEVIEAVVAHPEGDEITEKMVGLLAQITVRILGKADSIEQMRKAMEEIHDTIKVISNQGENMVLPGIEEKDFEGTILI